MTAVICKTAFFSVRIAGIACVFLSGVGTAGVMSHLPDMFGNEATRSCSACRTADLNSSARDMGVVSACSPVVIPMDPRRAVVTHSAPMAPDTAKIDWQALSAQSVAWQSNPDVWGSLPVRF